MDTQNDGLEKVTPFKMAIFGIHVRFLRRTLPETIPAKKES